MRGIRESYKDKIVDNIFWWLIVDGVVTFDNIDVWTDGKFHWRSSVEFAVFTDRGVVWLNELRSKGGLLRRVQPLNARG